MKGKGILRLMSVAGRFHKEFIIWGQTGGRWGIHAIEKTLQNTCTFRT